MDSSLIYLLSLSFIGSVAGLIGGVVFLLKKDWCKVLSSIATPLAAGVLLALSLLDLLPEAVEEVGNTAFTAVLVTFLVSFLIERFLFSLHHHDQDEITDKEIERSTVSLVIVGDTIHNFLDGVAIGASFLLNPSLSFFVALATFLHETPHEIADFGILVANGYSRKKAFLANFFSALATFPGALLTYFFAGRIQSGIGILLAVAAGVFLYVSTTDFLPEIGYEKGKMSTKQIAFLMLGVFLIVVLRLAVPEMSE